jgi:hypothetical protein
VSYGKARAREYMRRWRATNPEKVKAGRDRYNQKHQGRRVALNRERAYARDFGITVRQYEEILRIQGGTCAICGLPPKHRRLAVEHDHVTKRVRGLVCWNCNYFKIGRNTAASAERVLAYLRSDFDGRFI